MNADAQYISNRVRSFRRNLYLAAKRNANRRFGILMDKVTRLDVLFEAWLCVARNRGACGVDNQSIEDVKTYGVDRFLHELQEQLKSGNYTASEILRAYVPKDDGNTRPLGIPVVRDRVAQMAVKLVIEPLFEADFCDCSYGFRPRRSNQQAATLVHQLINTRKWAVDIDLKSYFDTIPHARLMTLIRRRVSDKRVLYLIKSWLTAKVFEQDQYHAVTAGSPQGGVLSPLLSNIYLHEFDRQWDERDGELVRFADDIVILCVGKRKASAALIKARQRLESLGLTLNEEKTGLTHIRDGFDFLGFHYRENWSYRRRRFVRIKQPRAKSMKKIRAKIKSKIKRHPLGAPLQEVIADVNRSLRGWANYFRIGNSSQAGYSLMAYTYDQLRLYWRRRKNQKRIKGHRKWPNSFFHDRGLEWASWILLLSSGHPCGMTVSPVNGSCQRQVPCSRQAHTWGRA